jgi:hypothetical protein
MTGKELSPEVLKLLREHVNFSAAADRCVNKQGQVAAGYGTMADNALVSARTQCLKLGISPDIVDDTLNEAVQKIRGEKKIQR